MCFKGLHSYCCGNAKKACMLYGLIFFFKSYSAISNCLRPHGLWSSRLLCPRNFPGKNTGVGCISLLQGIFPTQRLNPDLLHCTETLYHLSHRKAPCMLYELIIGDGQKTKSLQNKANVLKTKILIMN